MPSSIGVATSRGVLHQGSHHYPPRLEFVIKIWRCVRVHIAVHLDLSPAVDRHFSRIAVTLAPQKGGRKNQKKSTRSHLSLSQLLQVSALMSQSIAVYMTQSFSRSQIREDDGVIVWFEFDRMCEPPCTVYILGDGL